METNIQHGLPINIFPFYLIIFFGSWLYYTTIYIRSVHPSLVNNRITWYKLNLGNLKMLAILITIVLGILIGYFVLVNFTALHSITLLQWLLIISVPAAGALYTFTPPVIIHKKIRQVGWLKPFIVGYTWSGLVTFIPLIALQVQHNGMNTPLYPGFLFWFSNFVLVTILAVIFDVKDYKSDLAHNLATFPARYGIQNTYRYILLPATIFAIAIILLFQVQRHYNWIQAIVQLLPFCILLFIVLMPQKKRTIFHYLVVIDGIMLLKAVCGIISIEFF
jgi:4-hydroxybenzoate polyprenyltransferase